MVVAPRAIHGEPKDAAPDGADHVIEVIVAVVRIILFAIADLGIAAEEAGGDPAIVGDPIEFVSGDLLGEERVVRFVLIECADHIVAVSPGIRAVEIVLETIGVGVTGHVEPVTAPTFTVVR